MQGHVDLGAVVAKGGDRRAGGDASVERQADEATVVAIGGLARTKPETAVDDIARSQIPRARVDDIAARNLLQAGRQTKHFERPRPVGQPSDIAALLEPGDQTMNARLRFQLESAAHLLEGGRHTMLIQIVLDEFQKLMLTLSQHP